MHKCHILCGVYAENKRYVINSLQPDALFTEIANSTDWVLCPEIINSNLPPTLRVVQYFGLFSNSLTVQHTTLLLRQCKEMD